MKKWTRSTLTQMTNGYPSEHDRQLKALHLCGVQRRKIRRLAAGRAVWIDRDLFAKAKSLRYP